MQELKTITAAWAMAWLCQAAFPAETQDIPDAPPGSSRAQDSKPLPASKPAPAPGLKAAPDLALKAKAAPVPARPSPQTSPAPLTSPRHWRRLARQVAPAGPLPLSAEETRDLPSRVYLVSRRGGGSFAARAVQRGKDFWEIDTLKGEKVRLPAKDAAGLKVITRAQYLSLRWQEVQSARKALWGSRKAPVAEKATKK